MTQARGGAARNGAGDRAPDGAPDGASGGASGGAADWAADWAEHLRHGGTSTWREWRQRYAAEGSVAAGGPSPAALEVVRRLAERWSGRGLPELAARVLSTPVGGRGPVDQALAVTPHDAGVEPELLPARELVRVCVAVLAREYVDRADHQAPPPAEPRGRRWSRGPAFQVVGLSPQAQTVRAALSAAGHRPGGRRPTVLVIGGPLDAMMALHWRRRVERGAGLRWRRLWARSVAADRIPAALDLVAAADRWAANSDHRVRLILDPEPAGAVAAAAQTLGLELTRPPVPGDPATTDLLRRINQALATVRPGPGVARILGTRQRPWQPLGVPAEQLDWAIGVAERQADRLAGARHPIHGDPRIVVPSSDPWLERGVNAERTLEVALDVLAGLEGPRRTGGAG